ncbi:hypothetical protein [Streptomyces sp. NBC_01465]|uniref:hypothetical protein n=1 Tax=Streptomyces sp. NBC_01465 TaxID=2903878 RepID=UPI002E2FD91C|nr:hypothetical protein [Streptomyces sp. NBC_01465]
MLIEGYDDGPLAAGECLLTRPGFWSNYLLEFCAGGTDVERAAPEWFGDDGADTEALSETLMDPEWWPVFRVPASAGPGIVVVYRNLVGDYRTDFLLVPEGQSGVQRITGWEGELSGTGLMWQDLVNMADNPAPGAVGVEDCAARLLLVLPLLGDPDVPDGASGRVSAALAAVGVPQGAASNTADYLLARLTDRSWHDPTWGSPLSGS